MNQQIIDYLKSQTPDGELPSDWEHTQYGVNVGMRERFFSLLSAADVVIILGDYDTDGVLASKIAKDALRALYPTTAVSVLLPDRFRDGYGVHKGTIDKISRVFAQMQQRGKQFQRPLILTVDNGTAAAEVFAYAKEKIPGLSVIVTDHHPPKDQDTVSQLRQSTDLVCNPHIDGFSYDGYCGAGVIYKLLESAINDEVLLRNLQMYAGIATVADIMPMQRDNWKLTRSAIAAIRAGLEGQTLPPALALLFEKQGIAHPSQLNEDYFAWQLSPLINAMGRLQDYGAKKVFSFLDHPHPSSDICEEIIANNQLRKGLVTQGMEELCEKPSVQAAKAAAQKAPLWLMLPPTADYAKEGLCGLFAGKLAEYTGCPAIVLAKSRESPEAWKGSGRNVPGFDLHGYLKEVAAPYLLGFGGHKEACGVTANLEGLRTLARERRLSLKEMDPFLYTDIHTNPPVIRDTIANMRMDYALLRATYAPFGKDFALPPYEIECRSNEMDFLTMGEGKHFWTKLDDMKIIHFNHEDGALADPTHFLLRGNISENYYRGQLSLQFLAEEALDVPQRVQEQAHTVDEQEAEREER